MPFGVLHLLSDLAKDVHGPHEHPLSRRKALSK